MKGYIDIIKNYRNGWTFDEATFTATRTFKKWIEG
jgi:hypothetical protein